MIEVINKHHGKSGEYVGHGTALGNPYTVKEYGREACIVLYECKLRADLEDPASPQSRAIARLLRRYQTTGRLRLACFCAPLPCHANVIKKILEERLRRAA